MVPIYMSPISALFGAVISSILRILAFNSSAPLIVKIKPTMLDGLTPDLIKLAILRETTSVFPEPAQAII